MNIRDPQAFTSSNYNGINSVDITSAHPIFLGISSLGSGNGQSIIDLGTNPNAEIVQFASGQGVYAVVNTAVNPIPLPPALLLFSSGIIGIMGFAMRKGRKYT